MESKLTPKKRAFVDHYIETVNATESAKLAGYSPRSAYTAGCRLMKDPAVQEYLRVRMDAYASQKIASAEEVLRTLTAILRREEKEVVVVSYKDGFSETIKVPAKLSDVNRAAELLGKRYLLFTDKQQIDGNVGLNVVIDYGTDSCSSE